MYNRPTCVVTSPYDGRKPVKTVYGLAHVNTHVYRTLVSFKEKPGFVCVMRLILTSANLDGSYVISVMLFITCRFTERLESR